MVSRLCPADVIQLFFTANSLLWGLNKYQIKLFETHLYVIYDIYVTFPTTPYEIIKNRSKVSFDKLYNMYLGFN